MPHIQTAVGDTRVILHIDLDCFYAQVEQKRLGIPREVPVAVQQWDGLIAVNYAARAKGITRHMRVAEALLKCPELQLVHVETIGGDAQQHAEDVGTSTAGQESTRAETNTNNPATAHNGAAAGANSSGNNHLNSTAHLKLTQKACLERYRRANTEILKVLHRLAPTAIIQKASIDEVYMDVTAMVDAELEAKQDVVLGGSDYAAERHQKNHLGEAEEGRNGQNGNTTAGAFFSRPEDAFAWGSIVPGGPLDPGSEFDVRLACGAGIACRLRGAILNELSFTSSAGIACNKLLAKLGSAMHKPNQQTVIPPRAVPALLQDLPLSKLQGFGGKLGQELESDLGCSTAGQVAALPLETLIKQFGAEKARWIAEAVRGKHDDAVEEKERPKSMLAAKSFTATSDHAVLQRWLGILAAELAPRMAADEENFKRRAKTLAVHFRGGANPLQDRHRQGPMPKMPGAGNPCAQTIAGAAWQIFKARCLAEALPCNRLAISAVDFADLPVSGKASIKNLFEKMQQKAKVSEPVVKDEDGKEESNKGVFDDSKESEGREQSIAAQKEHQVEEKSVPEPSAAEASKSEGAAVPPELLGVDIEEQKRLLKEAAMLKELEEGKKRRKLNGSSNSGASGGGGKDGQSSIARFFARKN